MFDLSKIVGKRTFLKRFVYPIVWSFKDWINNFMSRFFRKDHLIDIRNKDFGYTVGYCDPSKKIELAIFKIFIDFIEKEEPIPTDPCLLGIIPEDDEWATVYKEMTAIYNWLKVERTTKINRTFEILKHHKNDWPQYKYIESEITEDFETEYGPLYEIVRTKDGGKLYEEYTTLDKEIDKKDRDALDRIMKIRDFLWT